MPLRRRRRRRRVGRWARLAITLSVVTTGTAIAIPALFADPPSLLVDGHKVTIKSKLFTVADATEAVGVNLVPGPVYTAVTHTLLGNDGPAPELILNGIPAAADTVVHPGDKLQVVPAPETVESVVTRQQTTQGPSAVGLPEVEKTLFHPGRGAVVEQKVGERSGEVVSAETAVPAVPAVPVTDKLVALTFDDGPDPTWTPQILEILKSEGVVATFCVVGSIVERHQELTRQIVEHGHMLCNHTSNHALLAKAPTDKVVSEVNGGADSVKAVTGVETAFYRPPGGQLTPTVIAVANERGQRVLHWSVDTIDYRKPPATVLVDRVMRNVGPGGVVLMHDGGGDRSQTVAAVQPMIRALKDQGYGLTTPAAVSPVPDAR